MDIGVLGTLTVDEESASLGRRDRVVLSALATRTGQVVSQDLLVDALWRDEPPASAQKVVHGCVSRLRRLLGAEAIETAPPGYRLAVRDGAVDSVQFERTVARARDLAAMGQVDRAAHMLDEALGLWRGRPFPDVDDWGPAIAEATRLEEIREEAQELRIDCYLRSGRHHEVLADAAALLRQAPTRAARWALLTRAQYQDGRQAEALATLQHARELLADRLGIDPGPELDRLQKAVLCHDPQLLPEPLDAGASTDRCPCRGLAAYDVGDSETFFGRDREIVTCLAVLETHGVLAVVGPSGSGKSSVVRAGVAAALSRAGTRVRVFTPGEAPMRALDALPRRSNRDAWVVGRPVRRGVLAVLRRGASVGVPGTAGRARRARPPGYRAEGGPARRAAAVPVVHPTGGARTAPSRCDGRSSAARRRRGPGAADRADPGARPGRPADPRGGGRAERAAAAVPRAAGDLAAPRGQHPHRGGLSGRRRHPRCRGADRGATRCRSS